jgi:predicted aspartyl protease
MSVWQAAWGMALAALVQLQGAPPPQPVMEGSSRTVYTTPSDGDTPVLLLKTSGGLPVRLLIDTGASRSMVSQELVQRLQLKTKALPSGNFALAGAGSDCPTDPPRQAVLPMLRLGELKIRELAVLVMPKLGVPPGTDGVLGASALRQLPLLIDPKQKQLRFDQQLTPQSAPADAVRIPLRWRDHVPLLQVSDQNGDETSALLDTGAEAVFIGVPLAQRLSPQSPPSGVEIQGFCGSEFAIERIFSGLSVANLKLEKSPAIVTRNRILKDLNVEAIIGQPLLKKRRQLWLLNRPEPLVLLW